MKLVTHVTPRNVGWDNRAGEHSTARLAPEGHSARRRPRQARWPETSACRSARLSSRGRTLVEGHAEVSRPAALPEDLSLDQTVVDPAYTDCQRLQIDPQRVLAIGDNDNDIPMLKAVGYGVAMGNATPGTKAVAKWVAIERLVLRCEPLERL